METEYRLESALLQKKLGKLQIVELINLLMKVIVDVWNS